MFHGRSSTNTRYISFQIRKIGMRNKRSHCHCHWHWLLYAHTDRRSHSIRVCANPNANLHEFEMYCHKLASIIRTYNIYVNNVSQ